MRRGFLAVALLLSQPVQAGYFTYAQWERMDTYGRTMYAAGAFDQMTTLIGTSGANGVVDTLWYSRVMHWGNCLFKAEMSAGQLAENVLNFAAERPNLQTKPFPVVLASYLGEACGDPPS